MMEVTKIGDVCDILNGFAFKSNHYVEKGVRVIRIANVQKGYIEDNTPAFYPTETKGIEKYMLSEGDLLMSLTGNVGRVAIIEKEMLPAVLNQRVACLRLKTNKIEKGYLFHILNSDYFENKCIQVANGVAQKNMSTEWLKEFTIPVYSREKQRIITCILDKMRGVIDAYKRELNSLDDLIKARFVELFGNCKNYKILDDLTTKITDGSHNPPKGIDKSEYLMLSSQNVFERLVLDDVRYLTKEDFDVENKRTDIQNGDVLLTIVGTIGRTHVVSNGEKYTFQRSVAVIKPIYGVLDGTFLSAYLHTPDAEMQLEAGGHGSSQKGIYLQNIKKLKIPVIDFDKQVEFKQFVEQLDKSKFVYLIIQKTCQT